MRPGGRSLPVGRDHKQDRPSNTWGLTDSQCFQSGSTRSRSYQQPGEPVAKYDHLTELLNGQRRELNISIDLTMDEIADAVSGGLPPSA